MICSTLPSQKTTNPNWFVMNDQFGFVFLGSILRLFVNRRNKIKYKRKSKRKGPERRKLVNMAAALNTSAVVN